MRSALGFLGFIIVVFSNSILLDAMLSFGANNNGERDNYHLQAGQYVTLYLNGVGALAGKLYAPPVSTLDVKYRFEVKLPDGRRFLADVKPIQIEEKEHLKESRYFIQIGKTYLVSDKLIHFRLSHNVPNDPVLLTMQSSNYDNDYLVGGLGYYEGPVPLWTEETYNRQRFYNLLFNHGGSGSGPSHASPKNKNQSK